MIHSGIEVYVKTLNDNIKCEEFTAPPNSPLFTPDLHATYIEAVDEERFAILVQLTPCFQWLGSDTLAVHVELEATEFGAECLVQGARNILKIDRLYCKRDGSTELVGHTFRKLTLSMQPHKTPFD